MRIRTIKPDFFRHEGLAELSFETRLCFQGLWCLADSEGRLEDRPKRIKADIFPYDDVDIEQMLMALNEHGFILRYEVVGKRYICMPTWEKHQRINGREAQTASIIPPAPGLAPTAAETQQGTNGEVPEKQEDSVGKQSGSIGEAPETQQGSNSEAAGITGNGNGIGREVEGNGVKSRKKRAHPPPEDFQAPVVQPGWVRENFTPPEIQFETEKFLDHHRAKGSLFVDWDSAWRGWMRNAIKFRNKDSPPPQEDDHGFVPEPVTPELVAGMYNISIEEATKLLNTRVDHATNS